MIRGWAGYFQARRRHRDHMAVAERHLGLEKDRIDVERQMVAARTALADAQMKDIELKRDGARNAALREERRMKLEHRLADLRNQELDFARSKFQQEREDQKEAKFLEFSRSIALEYWPVRIEPLDLLRPVSGGGRAPVTFLFRAPDDFDKDVTLILEDKLLQIVGRYFARTDAERPVRFYGTASWKPDAERRGLVSETLAKHSDANPTITLELLRVGAELVIDVAVWGFDPIRPGPPARSELGRIDWAGLRAETGDQASLLIEQITPTLRLAMVALIDSAHLRRNLVPPIGPDIVSYLLPSGDRRASLDMVETMRLQYNQIATAAPEIQNELRLMLGVSLAKLEDKTAATRQAFELANEWLRAPPGPAADDAPDDELIDGLASLFHDLGETEQAAKLAAAGSGRSAKPVEARRDWFVNPKLLS